MAKKDAVIIPVKNSPSKTAKGAKSGKSEKLAAKNVDKTSKKAAAAQEEEETAERSLKYQYPADVNTASKKKEFRRKQRARFDSLQKALKKYKGDKTDEGKKAYAEAEKGMSEFTKNVMSEGRLPRQ
jgi:hypothetical protein